MFDFQKLEVYKKSCVFHGKIRSLLKNTTIDPASRSQLMRASMSIVLNIAEGSGRMTKADRKNFFTIARSSIFECVALLEILKDNYSAFDENYADLLSLCDEMSRMLYVMRNNLNSP